MSKFVMTVYMVSGGACMAFGLLYGQGCAKTGLSDDQVRFRDEYLIDEATCVAKARSGVYTKDEGFDCVCKVMARRGKTCDVPRKDGGS